jgi:hypothetical protein
LLLGRRAAGLSSRVAAAQDAPQRQIAALNEAANGFEFARAQRRTTAQRVLLGGAQRGCLACVVGEDIPTNATGLASAQELPDV